MIDDDDDDKTEDGDDDEVEDDDDDGRRCRRPIKRLEKFRSDSIDDPQRLHDGSLRICSKRPHGGSLRCFSQSSTEAPRDSPTRQRAPQDPCA